MVTLEQIINAKTPKELFPDADKARKTYNRLLQIAHPDMYGDHAKKEQAQKAFIQLTQLWEKYNNKSTSTKTNVIKTRKHEYSVNQVEYVVNNSSYLHVTYDAGHKDAHLIIPNNAKDNDLHEEGIINLKNILKETPDRYKPFYPEFLEAFKYKVNGETKQITSISLPEGMFTLTQVKEDYPEGIDGRDIAWIFKRILIAIANAQDQGYIHGAINLDSVLIHPEYHGVTLTGWEYSIEKGDYLKAVPEKIRTWFPEYVFKKEMARLSLDTHLAAKTMEELLTENAPKQLRTFFKGCHLENLPHPGVLIEEFDELLIRIYGPKKFHHFSMKRTQKVQKA